MKISAIAGFPIRRTSRLSGFNETIMLKLLSTQWDMSQQPLRQVKLYQNIAATIVTTGMLYPVDFARLLRKSVRKEVTVRG